MSKKVETEEPALSSWCGQNPPKHNQCLGNVISGCGMTKRCRCSCHEPRYAL